MTAKKTISIACASAFWGDTPYAVRQILREPHLDYIAFDYLSEVTMTLLARFKKKDPAAGYIPDFMNDVIVPHLKTCVERNIKLISNAGALNPLALKKKIEEFAAQQGFKINVICVEGDDLLATQKLSENVADMSGKTWNSKSFLSANAYLGAPALVKALEQGADLVLTGRTVDTALVVAPLAFEFGWDWKDYDLLAQASLAGHIVECGTQCTGGNFTDWEQVPNKEDVGFPIIRAKSSGEFIISKPPNTGGLLSVASVAEQIVYEIGNPSAYILPDVVCDFTNLQVSKVSEGVSVKGAKGRAPTTSYKVSATLQLGWKISATAFMAGGQAKTKALAVGETLLKRCEALLNELSLSQYTETRIEALGDGEEVVLRISAAHDDLKALELLAKEIAPAATSLAPGLTNLLGGRAHPTPRIKLVDLLIDKNTLSVFTNNGLDRAEVNIPGLSSAEAFKIEAHKASFENKTSAKTSTSETTKTVPLYELAYARSGDKGNHTNVGVIARKPEYYEIIKRELTPEKVSQFFAQEFDSQKALQTSEKVEVWELPGIFAVNFLIKNCLGGGGAFSLKVDPQGKAYAQRLLQMPISSEGI